ncbi:type II toxin-antitoxin system VapC family toxin [Candidatus Fermentibacteria bacterium]|nr:type II toxin-antitoxin system VapC family toxin [Candidatus Fermentibacteria bacterium]
MILDTSAVLAIIVREPGWEALFDKIVAAPRAGIGAPTVAEAGIVLRARLGASGVSVLTRFLQEFRIETVLFGEEHWRAAVEAYGAFGKGHHPAGLNYGDCMAYATARLAALPLLCKGEDFPLTDIPLA